MTLNIAALAAFYAAIMSLTVSGAFALSFLRVQREDRIRLANRFMIAGSVLLVAVFVFRGLQWGAVPLVNPVESLNLFLLFSAAVAGVVLRGDRMRPLQSYYAPTLAVIALLTAVIVTREVVTGAFMSEPRNMNELLLTIHVGLACLAYALFFIASLTSVAYFVQVWRLKRHQQSGMFHKMPPLESLDHSLHRMVLAGYPLFLITVVLGAIWATSGTTEDLSETWWASPKFVHSVVTALFFAAAVHGRQLGFLRGRKFAYFLFYGFALVMLSFVGLRLLNLRMVGFWEAGT